MSARRRKPSAPIAAAPPPRTPAQVQAEALFDAIIAPDGEGLAVHVSSVGVRRAEAALVMALDDAATQRARADAAVAEVARLREERDAARAEAAGLRAECAAHERAISRLTAERDADREDADALREAVAGLRAIVDGRTVPPTIREARAHCHGAPEERGAFIATRLDWGAHGGARVATGLQPLPGAPHRWIAIDASGRPCAWPVTP